MGRPGPRCGRQHDDLTEATNLTLDQTCYHNKVNEIDTNDDHTDGPGASITASIGANWADPKYDAAGNMTEMPEPDWMNPANAFDLKYDASAGHFRCRTSPSNHGEPGAPGGL